MPTTVKMMAHTAANAVSARENGISTASASPSASKAAAAAAAASAAKEEEEVEVEARVSFCTSQMYGSCTWWITKI